jgi:hypothetical protein
LEGLKKMTSTPTPYTRVYPRTPIPNTPVFLDGDRRVFLGLASNVSRTGLFVHNHFPCKVDEVFNIEMTLPDTAITVKCHSSVVWCNDTGQTTNGPIRRGLRFVDIDPFTAEKLDRWVRSHLDPQDIPNQC